MSKVPKWHVKAVYLVFALALVVSLSGAFVVAVAPMSTSAADPDETNTLRIYGKCEENAAFPYTDYRGPFVLDDHELANSSLVQVPPMDFIQWNPAYLDHGDYGMIKADAIDASEKVHLRQWYVPKYCEPSGIVWANQAAVKSSDIVTEYTYILVDSSTQDPISGSPGMTTKLMLPIVDNNQEQAGLDDFDVDDDGTDDVTWIEAIGTVGNDLGMWPPVAKTIGFTPCVDDDVLVNTNNQIVAGTKWVDINTQPLQVTEGETLRFLDHAVKITSVNAASVTVTLWYSGNAADDTQSENMIVGVGETLSAGRHQTTYRIEDLTTTGPPSPSNAPSESSAFILGNSNLRLVKAPWYLQVTSIAGPTSAYVILGRLLVEGEAFFVDGAEYEIAMLHTPKGGINRIEEEVIKESGEGTGTEDVWGNISVANPPVWGEFGFFADCDGDGNVDSDDVDVSVGGVALAPEGYTINKTTGAIHFDVAPGILAEVTVDYCYDSLAFKYITIRNGIPKYDDVTLTALSVVKESIEDCDDTPAIPMLPPFNRVHDIIDDTNIPDCFTFVDPADGQHIPMPDVQLPDNLSDVADMDGADGEQAWGFITNNDAGPNGSDTTDNHLVYLNTTIDGVKQFKWVATADGCGDASFLPLEWNSITDRWIHDVPAVAECFVSEDKEPRFDTNLLEEKFTDNVSQDWRWKNIETLPWLYTEMKLPLQPDITDPVNNDDGDYILVSSWMTENSVNKSEGKIRMKFVYDAHVDAINSADIYVNDGPYNAEYNDEDSDAQTVIDQASLRVYGKCDLSAAFPYTTAQGPLAPQSWEAPEKDFIQWNAAYMDHYDSASAGVYGTFFEEIVVNGINANEKVHLRQWYVPKYTEPSGMVWMTPTCVTSPSIIKEYTYILLDDNNDPIAGLAGDTSFVFPIVDSSNEQIGLDDYDVNGDGLADIVFLETISAVDWNTSADNDPLFPPYDDTKAYECLPGTLTSGQNNIKNGTPWIDISTRSMNVGVGDILRFLDHSAEITSIVPGGVTVEVTYEGNTGTHTLTDGLGVKTIPVGETVASGRSALSNPEALLPASPPSQSAAFKGGSSDLELLSLPWYIQVESIAGDRANVVVGRLLTEGESFFVDGAEYEVARLDVYNMTNHERPAQDDADGTVYGLKYITLRNDLPKVEARAGGADDISLGSMSIWKVRTAPCYEWPAESIIPMLPPFNMQHDMIDDVNIPDAFSFIDMAESHYPQPCPMPDIQLPDNVWYSTVYSDMDSPYDDSHAAPWGTFLNGDNALADDTLVMVSCNGTSSVFQWSPVPDGYGDISFLPFNLNTIDERKIEDVAVTKECWKDEDKETRFDTNLVEEKFTELEDGVGLHVWNWVEKWEWKNIETLPWDYTEFVMPALPDITDPAAGISADDGDYILVSSFLTEDSDDTTSIDVTVDGNGAVRVKFYHDVAYSPDEKTGIYVNTGTDCWLEGDVNHDDLINSADLQLIAQHIVHTITLVGSPFQAADVNDDSAVNSADLQLIAQYLVLTIPAFPGGTCIP